jgi:hypothetical protein
LEENLATNDCILVDGIISERIAGETPPRDRGEAFELLCFEQILKNYDLSSEEFDVGWIDGRHDGGIDGLFVFVNGHLVSDVSQFPWPRTSAQLDVFIISCKHHDTFREATLNSLLATSQELFNLTLSESDFRGAYSEELLAARRMFVEAYKRLAITNPKIAFNFVYASRGDASEVGESVRARANQIEQGTRTAFSNVDVQFQFWGASELIEKYRSVKQFTLELPLVDYLTGAGEGYIVVTKLIDYYKFVCDDSGELRRYLFDSNVRDYLGENKVNEDIFSSLQNELTPDFWWLNNGITILATRAVINGKNMQMQDIQVVNGLQTTETVFRHFRSGSITSKDRCVSVKIIVSRDEGLRDQIIRATNNQSAVEQAALHATDKIQRDIEAILERYEYYYERRKNYYRNVGRPPSRFVAPLFVAAGYVAMVLKDPSSAATLRSRFMRKQSSYRRVFSEDAPVEAWPRIVAILKASEDVMLSAPRRSGHGERLLRTWRGLVGLLYVANVLGRFDYSASELAALPVDGIDRALLKACWEFIEPRRGGALRPGHLLVRGICREYADVYSIAEYQVIGKNRLPLDRSGNEHNPGFEDPPSEEFLEQVDALLPRQPWPIGIHKEIADKLKVTNGRVSRAIYHLIRKGKRLDQKGGRLFDAHGSEVVKRS